MWRSAVSDREPSAEPSTPTLPIFYAFTLLFASMLFLSTAFGAPNVPLNLDGWVAEALAKLETDGITGGFHRHTAPLSRTDVAGAIRQAESRIRGGIVVPSAIDRKLLEKLKREFAKELAIRDGRRMRFLPQLRMTKEKAAPAFEWGFHYTLGQLEKREAPRLTLYSEFEGHNFESPPLDGKTAEQRIERWRADYTGDFKRGYLQVNSAHLDLLVGRDWLFWGASPYKTVGISDNSPPFDQAFANQMLSKVKLHSLQQGPQWWQWSRANT